MFVEVPIAGGPGSKIRRIDAVRFTELENGIRHFDRAAFRRALDSVTIIEIIEVKRTLNRTVIGQLLVAQDVGPTEWNLEVECRVDLVALVTAGDAILEEFCRRNGIRVEIVDRDCEDADSGDEGEGQ